MNLTKQDTKTEGKIIKNIFSVQQQLSDWKNASKMTKLQ